MNSSPSPGARYDTARVFWAVVTALLLSAVAALGASTQLVPAGGIWRFLDDGSNQGSGWAAPGFDDSGWLIGSAQFGYGEGDEETLVSFGPDANNKFITTYFRTDFVLNGASLYTGVTLSVLRDDGLVVYLNGVEIFRNNMPAGPIHYLTPSVTNVAGASEETFYVTNLSAALLINGTNVLAAEVHQFLPTSADLSFDVQLDGWLTFPEIVRGPYLQQGGTTNVIVRWRTSSPSEGAVRFGVQSMELDFIASEGPATTEHIVKLTGLLPGTRYFYSVGTPELALAGDASYSFVTAPAVSKPTRIWVIGDSGTADSRPRSVYAAYTNFTGARHTDVWLMLGDNAYGSGTDGEFQAAVFNMFPEMLRQTVAWSTIGNHETYSGTFNDFPFLHLFSQPVNGEAGGVPSGTPRYFSFDYGNIHFVCLDAMTSDRSAEGPMCTWLAEDLAANQKEWLIAFWHHPPYTKGSHDSDYEFELVEMRQNAVPILEAYGVDLVLSGHSHCYERSFLINNHYGISSTFEESMKRDGGSGREDDSGPYRKPTAGPGANQGTVYIVAGSSGQATYGSLDHPIMYFDELQLGSLVLDIDGPVLQAKFLRETGAIDDYFTLIKGSADDFLRLTSFQHGNGLLTLTWNSRPGQLYLIEKTTNLTAPHWSVIARDLVATDLTMNWSGPIDPNSPAAYYRVQNYSD